MIDAGRIVLDPTLPWPMLAILAAATVVFCIGYAWRGGAAPVSRPLAFLLLLAALARPMYVREQREPARDIVALVVDQSESLELAGRLEAAQSAGAQLARRIAALDGLDVRLTEVRGGADGTAIVQGLESALRDAPADRIAGAILVTDGQVSDVPQDLRRLRAFGPVHAMIVGDPNRGDRKLELLSAPGFAIVGAPATVEARVDDSRAGVSVPVTVSVDGAVVSRLTAVSGQPFKVEVAPQKRGASMVIVEAASGPEEITLSNNRAAFELHGVRDRLRVLLVTGEPHAGARVWRNLLKSDPGVDLVHFTILRPPEKLDYTPEDELALITFPTRELFVEKLDGFDLIIFDRYRRRGQIMAAAYFENIAQRVRDGGALLIAAGPADAGFDSLFQTPLSTLLPSQPTGRVLEQRFRPALTEIGRRHPVTRGLPTPESWGRWTRQIDAQAPDGEILLQGVDGRPLLVLNRAGEGRVAQLWSDQAWLWARGYDGGGPHAELLRRLAHWLMQEPELEDERLTLRATPQGLVAERTTLGDAPAALDIVDPQGSVQRTPYAETAPGVYRAFATAAGQGLYEARDGALRAFAALGPANPKEAAAVAATDEKLRPLASASGGGVFFLGERGDQLPQVRRVGGGTAHADTWAGLRRRGAYTVRASAAAPLGPGWAWAAVGVALLLFSWRREGR